MKARLTSRDVLAIPAPAAGHVIYYDVGSVSGFGVRITAAGFRTFVLRYRNRATSKERLYSIGSPPAWSLGAAREEAKALKRRIDRGEDPMGELSLDRAVPKVKDLAERFEHEHIAAKRPSTASEYRGFIKSDLLPMLGSHKVSTVTYSDVAALHRRISARAPIAANRCVAMCSAMFNLAIKWGMRADNPCRGIKRNPEEPRQRYLSESELPALVGAIAGLDDRQAANIFKMLLLTGARAGEVMSAEWTMFALDVGTWIKPSSHTKQKREHRVPLSAAAVEVLKAIRAEACVGAVYVFPARGGGHRVEVRRAWKQVCAAAEIAGLKPHDLRHSFASALVNSGLSLHIVGRLLGHSQSATTFRYSHLADSPLREGGGARRQAGDGGGRNRRGSRAVARIGAWLRR